jgi:hypothetical protein
MKLEQKVCVILAALMLGAWGLALNEHLSKKESYAQGFEAGGTVMNSRYMSQIQDMKNRCGWWFEACDHHGRCEHLTVACEESYAP